MPTAAGNPHRLTDAQLREVLDLAGHADSVELKLTVPDSERRATVDALGMDPLDAQIRQVFFFDTPDLRLDHHGVVVRARRVQGRGDDTVVKLRPIVPGELPPSVREAKTMVVEVDAMPGGYVCSASFKGALERPQVRQVAAGDLAVRRLFSKQQRAFYAAHAPEGLGLDDLTVLGPITVLKLKFSQGSARRLVAELWLYPDGERILELSTKCLPGQGFQVAAELRAFLAERGVDLYGEQQTKTRTALEYFSGPSPSRLPSSREEAPHGLSVRPLRRAVPASGPADPVDRQAGPDRRRLRHLAVAGAGHHLPAVRDPDLCPAVPPWARGDRLGLVLGGAGRAAGRRPMGDLGRPAEPAAGVAGLGLSGRRRPG
jgi:hypothetical protein